MKTEKKSILGIGNALTDILAVLPDDSFLKMYHLPKGSKIGRASCRERV